MLPRPFNSATTTTFLTNGVLNEEELREAKSVLSEAQLRLQALDYDIENGLNSFVNLSERHDLRQFIDDLLVLTAPIRNVPADIIELMILHALQTGPGLPVPLSAQRGMGSHWGLIPTTLNTKKAPWTYAQVCQAWRRICLHRSLIWSHISIIGDHACATGTPKIPYIPEILTEIFHRAKSQPLTIKIVIPTPEFQWQTTALETMLRASWRWGKADLEIHPVLLWSFQHLRFPLLQELHLRSLRDRYTRPTDTCHLFSLMHAPELRSLRLYGFGDLSSAPIPWTQIETFEHSLDCPPAPILHRWIQKLTNVTSLHIGTDISRTPVPDLPYIRLPHLKHLHASCLSTHPSKDAITWLILPNLESAQIYTRSIDRLSACIQKSHCTLTTLYLNSHFSKDFPLVLSTLSNVTFASITILKVKEYQDGSQQGGPTSILSSLSKLLIPSFNLITCALPNLESLTMETTLHNVSKFSLDYIPHLIASRWNIPPPHCPPLKRLETFHFFILGSLDSPHHITETLHRPGILEMFWREGMDTWIRSTKMFWRMYGGCVVHAFELVELAREEFDDLAIC